MKKNNKNRVEYPTNNVGNTIYIKNKIFFFKKKSSQIFMCFFFVKNLGMHAPQR